VTAYSREKALLATLKAAEKLDFFCLSLSYPQSGQGLEESLIDQLN
jgi:hypothetical protein